MMKKVVFCLLALALCLSAVSAQWGGGGGFDPLVGGPNRQWRRYSRCLQTGFCPYDPSTGHYYGRRELMAYGGGR